MKALDKARAEYDKAIARREKTKKQLEADELAVTKWQAAVEEAENNEYVGMARELQVSVETFAEIIKQLKQGKLPGFVFVGKENKENGKTGKKE